MSFDQNISAFVGDDSTIDVTDLSVKAENETLVIPQVWFRISPEAYIKAGGGKNLAGEKNAFLRIAFEIEL